MSLNDVKENAAAETIPTRAIHEPVENNGAGDIPKISLPNFSFNVFMIDNVVIMNGREHGNLSWCQRRHDH